MGRDTAMRSASARRRLCVLAIVVLACSYASTEAATEEEADLSNKGVNPFDGSMTQALADAKKKHAELQRRGGVAGTPDGGKLMKKWMAQADAKYSRKAKKRLHKMNKLAQKTKKARTTKQKLALQPKKKGSAPKAKAKTKTVKVRKHTSKAKKKQTKRKLVKVSKLVRKEKAKVAKVKAKAKKAISKAKRVAKKAAAKAEKKARKEVV